MTYYRHPILLSLCSGKSVRLVVEDPDLLNRIKFREADWIKLKFNKNTYLV
jgi:hypothetical protein